MVEVALVQGPSYGQIDGVDLKLNLQIYTDMLRESLANARADLVLLPELFLLPYFCSSHDPFFRRFAEPIPGPTTEILCELAIEFETTIAAPVFEQTTNSTLYNSCVVILPDGSLASARLSNGAESTVARKCHLGSIDSNGLRTDEKFWFRPGDGLAVFDTPIGRIGCLICYDRSFPESWQTVVAMGSEIVIVPVASSGARSQRFVEELQIRAAESGIFVAAANRVGQEFVDRERWMFGNSVLVAPDGKIVALASEDAGSQIVRGKIDLGEVARTRAATPYLRDLRPEIYRSRAGS